MDTSLINEAAGRGDLVAVAVALLAAVIATWLKLANPRDPEKADSMSGTKGIADVSARVNQLDKRLARVESDIEHLPTREELHIIELNLARMTERSIAIERTTEATGRAVGRIEDFMISVKKGM